MVAEVLQAPYETIEIKCGDTDYLKDGGGTHSGRSMRMGAIVLSEASRKIIARAGRVAAHVLEAADIDIEYADAMFTVAGTDQRLSLFDVAAAARNRDDLPDDLKGELKEDADVYLPRAVIGSGCHVCEVEIDSETGVVEVVDWTAVDDVSRAINPMTLDGQTMAAFCGRRTGFDGRLRLRQWFRPNDRCDIRGLRDASRRHRATVPYQIAGSSQPVEPVGYKAGQ